LGPYALGIQPGTLLRGNHIHDVRRRGQAVGAPNNGFFIDQASKGFHFENNVAYRTSGRSVRFNQSQHGWHTWKDNYLGDKEAEAKGAKAIIEKAGIEGQ
jgi:hypothetical protein